MKTINIGKENATFQEILALKENRTKRANTKLFFVEGTQNIKDAISNGWQISAFIYNSRETLSDWAKSVLSSSELNYCINENLMQKLSDKSEPSELLAIIKMKEQKFANFSKTPLLVLVDRPSKKGNFGTIIRSCDALFVDQLFFIGHSVDIYDKDVITSSMGSFFRLPFKFIESNKEVIKLINTLKSKYKGFQIVATSLDTNNNLWNCDFKKPTLLLVGNEAKGISKFLADTADTLVKIDMKNDVDSLNVACATTACLYEISRQRTK